MSEIEYFDTNKIRKGREHLGRHAHFSISVSESTANSVSAMVARGPGKYSSAVVELAIRLLLALVSEDPSAIERIFDDLIGGVKSPYFARNLTKLYRLYMQ